MNRPDNEIEADARRPRVGLAAWCGLNQHDRDDLVTRLIAYYGARVATDFRAAASDGRAHGTINQAPLHTTTVEASLRSRGYVVADRLHAGFGVPEGMVVMVNGRGDEYELRPVAPRGPASGATASSGSSSTGRPPGGVPATSSRPAPAHIELPEGDPAQQWGGVRQTVNDATISGLTGSASIYGNLNVTMQSLSSGTLTLIRDAGAGADGQGRSLYAVYDADGNLLKRWRMDPNDLLRREGAETAPAEKRTASRTSAGAPRRK